MPDAEFPLLGDAVWLDFVNTACGRADPPSDLLPDRAAWIRWAHTRHLDPAPVEQARLRLLRDHLLALAGALAGERPPPGPAIALMNQVLTRAEGGERLIREGGRWHLRFVPARPAAALDTIVRSAAATLADPIARVRRCAGPGCSLYFIDETPAGRRRWCDPDVCGRGVKIERRRSILQ